MRFKHRWITAAMAFAGALALSSTHAVAGAADDANPVFGSGMVAVVGADALSHITGNVGVNIAAGAGNRQSNTLMIMHTSEASAGGNGNPTAPEAMTVNEVQSVGGRGAGMVPVRVTIASLGAGALANAVGNIGVNIAAGNGNVQQNVIVSR